MNLEDESSVPYILASVSHPKFKLNWIEGDDQQHEQVKKLFLAECHKFFNEEDIENRSSETWESGNGDDFFNQLKKISSKTAKSKEEDTNRIDKSNMIESLYLDYINDKNNKISCLHKYNIIKKKIYKYNTTLPSSALGWRYLLHGETDCPRN